MTDSQSNGRYELKLQAEGLRLFQVRQWIRLHSLAFKPAYPPRQVNNIYFDTSGLDSLNDHLSGVGERRKLRFRWYGENIDHAVGQLEIKHKINRYGWKSTMPIQTALNLAHQNWGQIKEIIQQHTEGIFYELISISQPVIINSYQRDYYIASDGQMRLTLDYEIAIYDQQLSINPNITFHGPLLNLVILEIKSDTHQDVDLPSVVAEFPLRTEKHSKYVTGMSSIAGW
jgi:SPX domain protein involved in polyphosphate accumulation